MAEVVHRIVSATALALVVSAVSFAHAAEAEPAPSPPQPASDSVRAQIYGFAELNTIYDTTQSYGPASNNNVLARPATYAGTHGRTQLTANNSLIGVTLTAPEVHRVRAAARAEMDFFGIQPSDATERAQYTFGAVRMRLFYLRLETPIVDLIAGQYHELFGWGGAGFYANSVAFLGLAGEIYSRQPQIRLSRTVTGARVNLDLAAAAVRPVQRDSQLPDFEAGARLAIPGWTGVAAQASGRPDLFPLAVGLSAVSRRFAVAEFVPMPGEPKVAYGWGAALNLLVPIIRPKIAADNTVDRGNALTLLAEATAGTGIADLYTGLTGGALFPTLPNPGAIVPPPLYRPNIDSGIVTFDANGNLRTIDWRALLISAQYYLPIPRTRGRVWLSATYSHLRSPNIARLTPEASRGAVFVRQDYADGNLFAAVTSAVQIGVSYQLTRQVFGDNPFGLGPIASRNHRFELGCRFFF